MKLKKMY